MGVVIFYRYYDLRNSVTQKIQLVSNLLQSYWLSTSKYPTLLEHRWQVFLAAGQNRHSAGKSEAVVYIARTNHRLF